MKRLHAFLIPTVAAAVPAFLFYATALAAGPDVCNPKADADTRDDERGVHLQISWPAEM